MVWKIDDTQGDEASKVKYDVVRYTRGIGLDLGCGPTKAFPNAIGVDNKKDTELFGIEMKPQLVVEDCADLSSYIHQESCDFVFSSHLLEHIEDAGAAVAHWWTLLKVGGYLILYLPHRDLYPNIGQPGANPDHKHDFVPEDVVAMVPLGWDLVMKETRDQGREYSFLLVFKKTSRGEGGNTASYLDPKPAKTAIVVRHGGYGDQLQAASILPALKRQGFHITILTTPKGRSVLDHDPHIDDWFMVDVDQVPNPELGPFWEALSKRYDRFINLNESVEGTFLALPGRIQHTWPHRVRHRRMNENYSEFAALLADVPFVPEGRFYATPEEEKEAKRFVSAKEYSVMWVLAGSSPHKFTPHMDDIIHMILVGLPAARVFLVGDEACKILEQGWEDNDRVTRLSGTQTIRETLALSQVMNHVVGPETGVLNCVAYEPMITKTVLLSHSSAENLTKHWPSTIAIPGVAPCYPCHQLHFTSQYCPRDEKTYAAICQANINPLDIYNTVFMAYQSWDRAQVLRRSVINDPY
ncbi:MAG: methyltransferase domain-containing protein [Polyangiaceae bacterium]|jgi:ADP-heptose:LPS heptosyltransferase/predicted SAM-dependent methyltransferase|nr:methyltransferase domain-containing protein [Polyangiaceae bacterium]